MIWYTDVPGIHLADPRTGMTPSDLRDTARACGSVAVLVLVSVTVFLVLLDLLTLMQQLRMLRKNLLGMRENMRDA